MILETVSPTGGWPQRRGRHAGRVIVHAVLAAGLLGGCARHRVDRQESGFTRAWATCLRQADALDDGTADVATLAVTLRATCAVQEEQLKSAFQKGMDPQGAQIFETQFDQHALDNVKTVIVSERNARAKAPPPPVAQTATPPAATLPAATAPAPTPPSPTPPIAAPPAATLPETIPQAVAPQAVAPQAVAPQAEAPPAVAAPIPAAPTPPASGPLVPLAEPAPPPPAVPGPPAMAAPEPAAVTPAAVTPAPEPPPPQPVPAEQPAPAAQPSSGAVQ